MTAEGCATELIGLDTTCQQTDTTTYIAGCVNEHLDEDKFCSRHAAMLLSGELLCDECWPLGHHLPVTALAKVLPTGERIRVETLAGAR